MIPVTKAGTTTMIVMSPVAMKRVPGLVRRTQHMSRAGPPLGRLRMHEKDRLMTP
jgi:hypothetical protein